MSVRADAKRNHDKLLQAAREVFRERGLEAPLDEVARRAGVGAGTLYRHFPTRDDLLNALMQAFIDRLDAAADAAIAVDGSPRERLLSWVRGGVAEVTYSKGAAARLTAALGDDESRIATKAAAFAQASGRVVEALGADLRPGVDGVQLARLVGGLAMVVDQGELDESAFAPLADVLVDGLLAPTVVGS
ncbi:TetR/AcrR family transcriptional regulator [Nocardioides jiangxiensis]|uniref:Helix-turn-helix domain-containing protein n=1 Tax=Nocardioides jiangxiensis TaxID=3064524 RepID=A0ABT9B0H0_9ACTN|nr:TetR/AcrR family transcriptional regulator [Nocardioides sp. WY-20]MDO7867900.1 helix-turn-helix domain-containing protein [Nocardioides sp. WY-20]